MSAISRFQPNNANRRVRGWLWYGEQISPATEAVSLRVQVGITIARLKADACVVLTDLPEAKEIAQHNLMQTQQSNITFSELNWEEDSQEQIHGSRAPPDLVIAADCTYNPDSRSEALPSPRHMRNKLTPSRSPALVNTLHKIARASRHVKVAIAMKIRHSSERVFFDLMHDAGFRTTNTTEYPLPGDESTGEETVYLYTYSYEE
jgi:hypothetical protein